MQAAHDTPLIDNDKHTLRNVVEQFHDVRVLHAHAAVHAGAPTDFSLLVPWM